MAKPLDEAAVRRVAELARLDLPDDQFARFVDQLARVLTYVEQLNELNTDGVEPTAHPLALVNVLREDLSAPGLTAEQALANAAQREGGFFRVPRVLDAASA